MNFLLDNWHLVLMALASGGLLLWPIARRGSAAGSIGTAEAVRLINREKGVLIDIGEPADFAAGHAAGARNVPLGQLGEPTPPKGLPSNKTLPLLLLCPTGARAGKAVALLKKAGFDKAVAVAGGTAAWREASLPIEKGSGKPA